MPNSKTIFLNFSNHFDLFLLKVLGKKYKLAIFFYRQKVYLEKTVKKWWIFLRKKYGEEYF